MHAFPEVWSRSIKIMLIFILLNIIVTNGKQKTNSMESNLKYPSYCQRFICLMPALFTYVCVCLCFVFIHLVYVPVACAPSESREVNGTTDDVCVHTLKAPSGFFKRHFDKSFLKKFFKHWIPFVSNDRVKMQFFLYKRDFPECGREIVTDDVDSVTRSGFNADHPTR